MDKNNFLRTMGRIHELGRIFRPPKMSRKQLKRILDLDISMPHIMVIRTLRCEEQEPTNSSIGRELSVPPAMMTRIVSKLEKKELVERVRDKTDMRIWHVRLTPKGRNLAEKAQQMQLKHMMQMLDGLSPADRMKIMKSMGRIADILSKYHKGDIK